MSIRLLSSLAALSCSSLAVAQVDFAGNYAQDFDGLAQSGATTLPGKGPHAIEGVLGSAGVLGWFGANFVGTSQNTEFKAHDGSLASSAGRGVVFFGADGSWERALGALPTSNQISSFGVVLVNASDRPFVSIDISYVGEQWRAGDPGLLNALAFSYGFGTSLVDATTAAPSLGFAAPNLSGGNIAIDGNAKGNRVPVSGRINGIVWQPGQAIVLRWDISELSGQDNGLAIDDLVVTATPGISSLDLADYELVAAYPLPFPAADEASAVTYDFGTDTLFVIGDEGEAIVETTTTGQLLSQMTLTGFDDTQGLTWIGGRQLVVVEERIQTVYLVEFVAGGVVARSSLPAIVLGPFVGNSGLEGIGYDPVRNSYVTVKEKNPQAVNEAFLDWSIPSGTTAPLFVPALGVLDLSDVQPLATVASLAGTPDADNILVYSQESSRLLEVNPSGEVLSSFDFAGIAGDAEGVTIGPDGTIYVVGETPALYVLKPRDTPKCPADLDGDGSVGSSDLAILLGAWGTCASCAADIDGDGMVGSSDLARLLGAWGACAG